jgi:hypothetical protein
MARSGADLNGYAPERRSPLLKHLRAVCGDDKAARCGADLTGYAPERRLPLCITGVQCTGRSQAGHLLAAGAPQLSQCFASGKMRRRQDGSMGL